MATKSEILTMAHLPADSEWLDGTAGFLDAATLGEGDPAGEFIRPTDKNGVPFVDATTGGTIYWTPDGKLAVSHVRLSPAFTTPTRVTLPAATAPVASAPTPAVSAPAIPVAPAPSAPVVPPGTTTTHTVTVGDQAVTVTATHTETHVQATAPIPESLKAKLGHAVVVIGTDLEHALAQLKAFFAVHVFGQKPEGSAT